MASRKQIECDGCGDLETLGVTEEPKEITCVLISLLGRADDRYDLCSRCRERLVEVISPLRWPRIRPERA